MLATRREWIFPRVMSEPDAAWVECYSGYTYAQEPREVVWQGRRYPVVRVEQRWRTPEGPAFQVATEPGDLFEICYHELEGRWTIRLLGDPLGPGRSEQSDGELDQGTSD